MSHQPDLTESTDARRRFTTSERAALLVAADGVCCDCGSPLDGTFHADHRLAHKSGGPTDVVNGDATCPTCNRVKADRPAPARRRPRPSLGDVDAELHLRAWQKRFLGVYRDHDQPAFLCCAAPGAGKTIPALTIARDLISAGTVRRVVVVCPTASLCRQWSRAAHRLGLRLEPNWSGAAEPADCHGIVVTYQRVAHAAATLRWSCSEDTLVIADEPHHLGDELRWGETFAHAFEPAVRWLLLSGTPWRADACRIPGVRYDSEGVAQPDFSYSYGEAARDRVCRSAVFVPYDGQLRWTSDGDVIEATFQTELSRRESSRRLRTALAPKLSEGLQRMIADAHSKLMHVRVSHPDAGGLVVCEDTRHADEIASALHAVTGAAPVIVTSHDSAASQKIEAFANGTDPWIVAVNMVSEGVDIPRLRVGVYATPKKTPLLFAQIVGRFVRTSAGTDTNPSYIYLPGDPVLRNLAHEIEEQLRHHLPDADQITQADESGNGELEGEEPQATSSFVPLGAQVRAQGAVLSGAVIGDPDLAAAVDTIARKTNRSAEAVLSDIGQLPAVTGPTAATEAPFEARERLRRERKRLVGRLHHHAGRQFDEINTWVNGICAGGRRVDEQAVHELEHGNRVLVDALAAPSAA